MEPNFNIEKEIVKHVVRTAGVLVILILVSWDWKLFLGYVFALTISSLMFLHTLTTTKKALNMTDEKKVKHYMMRRYVLHYIINGATLAAAYKSPYLGFGGAIFGLLTIKIGLFTWAFWRNIVYFFQSGFKRSR